MEEKFLEVNYIVDGKFFVIPTKVIYDISNGIEKEKIHYEIKWKNLNIKSEISANTEFAIVNLQKALPENMRVACCQSCRSGNFCPYGDNDNEIFCLKDMIINDKNDLLDFFIINPDLVRSKSRELLYFCNDYQHICYSQYYTYNGWDYYNKTYDSK